MKNTMKKLSAILVALMLVFSFSAVAFAADTNGTITVSSAADGEEYNAYQILTLESYDTDTGIYLYKANPTWEAFVNGATNYLTVDAGGYVTWVEGADVKAFAKEALAYATTESVPATQTKTAADGKVEFTGLELGYYLLDSSLGTLLHLTTTSPDASVTEKNAGPTIDKEVKEDSTGNWGDKNDADLFQEVEFRATIVAQEGAENYVMHDTMSAGLTFTGVTKVTLNGNDVDASNYTVKTEGITDGCTFEVVFGQAWLDTLVDNDNIVVEYTGNLNENAVIFDKTNPNEVKLTYGAQSETAVDKTETVTYEFDLVKTDSDNKVLAGAEFKLYDAKTEGNEIGLIMESAGSDSTPAVYRKANAGETPVTIVVPASGIVTIKGLDGQTTYYLEETQAPAGYNGLTERVEVSITDTNLKATVTDGEYQTGGIQVINKTGAVLPETGGIGTTIFTIVGLALILGAGILLIVKKRTTAIAE